MSIEKLSVWADFVDFFGIFSDGGLTPDKVLIIGIFSHFLGPQSGATDSGRPHYS
jgi:hypothetical protein